RERSDALAGPGFADQAEHFTAAEHEVDAVDGSHNTRPCAEFHGEAAGFENDVSGSRFALAHRVPFVSPTAVRRPSPIWEYARTVSAPANAVSNIRDSTLQKFSKAERTSDLQLACGAFTPSTMKLRFASAIIAIPKSRLICTSTGDKILRST